VQQFRLNEAILMVRPNAEALHQARVALRRLQSAFVIFKPVISSDIGTPICEELRWLASELGDARNLDVLLERSRQGPLHDTIKTARETAYDKIDADLRSARVRALMLDLAEWMVMGDWLRASDTEEARQQPAREFAARALDRFYRKVKKDGRDIVQTDDEARHRVRKDAKKLRYAAEFFTSLFADKREKRRLKKFIAALEELQDKLGELNDLATAPQVLARLGIIDDPGASALLGKAKKKVLLVAAADAHDELMDANQFWR
jgi:CHAD domain-containing protein